MSLLPRRIPALAWTLLTPWLTAPGTQDPGAGKGELGFGPVPGWVARTSVALPAAPLSGPSPYGTRELLNETQVDARSPALQVYQHLAWSVLDPLGLEQGSEISIDFDPAYQVLAVHAVHVLRDGQVLERTDPESWQVLQREVDLDSRIYDGTLTALAFLEDVRIGDALEVEYTLTGSNPVLGGNLAESFALASDEPQECVRFRLLWPTERALQWRTHGTSAEREPRITHDGPTSEYLWEALHTDAIDVEDDVPDWFDPFPWVELTSFTSWADVRGWAESLYRIPRELPEPIRAKVAELCSGTLDSEERVLACLGFVRDEVRYLGIELGQGSYVPTEPLSVFQRRFGDCKDKSLLLVSMLSALGVEAQPALVNAYEGAALDHRLPSPHAFDHMLLRLRLDGREHWVDPTDSLARGRLGRLSVPDLGWALVLGDGASELVRIPEETGAPDERRIVARYEADEPGAGVALEIETTYIGRQADALRFALARQTHEEYGEKCVEYYRKTYPALESAGPIEVDDDERENVLAIVERYRIPDFWSHDESDVQSARFDVPELLEALYAPERSARTMPFAVDLPDRLVYSLRAHIGKGWSVDLHNQTIPGKALRFERRETYTDGTLALDYELERLREHLEPEDVPAHVEELDRIRKIVGYHISTSEKSALDWQAIAAGCLGAFVLIALVTGLALGVRLVTGPSPAFERQPLLAGPWFTIWSHPRATFARALARGGRMPELVLLTALTGVLGTWDRASLLDQGDQLGLAAILGGGILCGPLTGLLQIALQAGLLLGFGRMLGGQGTFRQVYTVVATSRLIVIWAGLLWAPALLLVGQEMFTAGMPRLDDSSGLMAFVIGMGVVESVASLWSFVVLAPGLAEAQRFTLGKAILSLLLLVFLVLGVVLVGVVATLVVPALVRGG